MKTHLSYWFEVKHGLIKMELPTEIIRNFQNFPETKRIFYEDAYVKNFESQILGIEKLNNYYYIVLKETAFFPESGGQEGDQGIITSSSAKCKVVDTQAIDERIIVHICDRIKGDFHVGDKVYGEIDWNLRYNRMRHHTGSHIVFAAMREVLEKEKLIYMGVHVGEELCRIDISYDKPISDSQMLEVERLANNVILENRPVKIFYMDRKDAEKTYGDKLGITEVTPTGLVRVVEIENWDVALCSGTHVKSTVEVGIIKILERYKLKKGVQRIRFAAGHSAYNKISDLISKISEIARILNTSPYEVDKRVKGIIARNNELKKEIEHLKKNIAKHEAKELLNNAVRINELKVIVKAISDADPYYLQEIVKNIVSKDPTAVVIIGSIVDKVYIVGGAGKNAIKKGIKINELIDEAKNIIEGKGGGSPYRIQLVGTKKEKLSEVLRLYEKKLLKR